MVIFQLKIINQHKKKNNVLSNKKICKKGRIDGILNVSRGLGDFDLKGK